MKALRGTARVLPMGVSVNQPQQSVADVFFDAALEAWWNLYSWGGERMKLLEEFGMHDRRAMQLSTWRWETLPREVHSFIVQHALSGKPMEYLR